MDQKVKTAAEYLEDPDYDEFGVVNMFTDTNYQPIVFKHGDFEQKVYAL